MVITSKSMPGRAGLARRRIAAFGTMVGFGHVTAVNGLSILVKGFSPRLHIGQSVHIDCGAVNAGSIRGEVIRVSADDAWVLPHAPSIGLSVGTTAQACGDIGLAVCDLWLGRTISPLGLAIDGKGPLPRGSEPRPLRAPAPPAGERQRLGPPISLGVRALDAFATVREGQRLGLFAASGVGKSTLLAMLSRNRAFDVTVIGLVGERGRELREFIEDDLGPQGLARSVIICATSDDPPLKRRDAAFAAMAVAEHFRSTGKRVLLLIDSVTRFAQACREIALAIGEPPATRGFPPSVFAEIPMLLERAGPGRVGEGSITALITVLVEGDDHDEPIADCVRGVLDGHVVLERRLAERGQYPPINVLRSLSRSAPGCLTEYQADLALRARRILALHEEMADLVRIGGYTAGAATDVDEAMRLGPLIQAGLLQSRTDVSSISSAFQMLAAVMHDAAG